MQPLELEDIQRIVLDGHKSRPLGMYALLRIRDAGAARSWLDRQLEHVGRSHAAERAADRAPDHELASRRRLALAFTYDGLAALGVPASALATFVPEFREGMSAPRRSRVLSDVGRNAPEYWLWGSAANPVHVLCAAFARSEAELAWPSLQAELNAPESGLELVDAIRAKLEQNEPFGFRDGISQPFIEGSGTSAEQRVESWGNRVKPGEFVLGYPNELAKLPASPFVSADADPQQLLPAATPWPRRDLGKNGSFLVVRELAQDLEAFARLDPEVQARMVGRWQSGAPLVLAPERDDPALAKANDFTYYPEDRHGLRCPLGAHVRRSNPRDSKADPSLLISTEDAIQSTNHHRLLRRGRFFERPAEHGRPASRGIFFLCFNANLERQFEFVQQTWLQNPKFAGLQNERDPMVAGIHGGADRFSIPDGTAPARQQQLEAYVTLQGGAYFFLPGLRALRYLTQLGRAAAQQQSRTAHTKTLT
jgi:Dyp-type peroxidase family